MKQNQGAEKLTDKKSFNMFIWITTCIMVVSPIFLAFTFILTLKRLYPCIDVTDQMYMLLGVSFLYAYVIKNYFYFVWSKQNE
jgi:hypothetical protein